MTVIRIILLWFYGHEFHLRISLPLMIGMLVNFSGLRNVYSLNTEGVKAENIMKAQFENKNQLMEGQKQYEMIMSKLPQYGLCWKKAVEDLHKGCKELTDDIQSRVALKFTNCFLQKLGMKTYPCSSEIEVRECVYDIDDKAFASYTEFFTHTQSICFFLQSQVWQEQTEAVISKLSINSARVSHQLKVAGETQEQLLQLQRLSLSNQNKLVRSGEGLSLELERSRDNVRILFEEFKSSTNEQRVMIFEVFERVSKLQSFVLGEFSGFYSLVFYLVVAFVSYLLTSTSRTREARFWLFALFTANFLIERLLTQYSLEAETKQNKLLEADGPVYWHISLCRKLVCGLAVAILSWFAYKFQDFAIINNQLLTEIQQQNRELKIYLENMGHSTPGSFHPMAMETSLNNSSFSDQRSFTSESGLNSSSDFSDDETFICNLSHSEVNKEKPETTPNGIHLGDRGDLKIISQAAFGVTSDVQVKNEPDTPEVIERRYNLRARIRPQQTVSEVITDESIKTFAKTVKNLARISRHNSQKVRQTMKELKKQHTPFFSSDED
ncbi:uncharacterized protein LOC143253302 isoform X1 [Tachypleus tridentatus]|uniref:uncharacterized protein LOC143253302 isoform X1 n=1 Tax=Tachypleus tridentatus TaxID=6853 RepID=UPI003FD20546